MIAFGPVPSRRLGRSLGINNIPPKICTYSCVYCQVGRTRKVQVDRQPFYKPEDILQTVSAKVEKARALGEPVEYLTLVPDGEPTLDVHLGREIQMLKCRGLPIAVIGNASLMWRQDVREDLLLADWVSLKIDAVEEAPWHRINRPHRSLALDSILEGALEFAKDYESELVTETMLVAGANDSAEHVEALAQYVARLKPNVVYLSIPIRPPAEPWVRAPGEESLNQAYQIMAGAGEKVRRVETLTGYEGNAFASTGDVEEDLLSITSVHPMRQDAVNAFLARTGSTWLVVERLVDCGQLEEVEYHGHKFYLRKHRPSWSL